MSLLSATGEGEGGGGGGYEELGGAGEGCASSSFTRLQLFATVFYNDFFLLPQMTSRSH